MTATDKLKIKRYEHYIDNAITCLSKHFDSMAIDCLIGLSKSHPGKRVTFSPIMGTMTFYIGNEALNESDREYSRHGIADFIEEVDKSWQAYGNDIIPTAVIRMVDGKIIN